MCTSVIACNHLMLYLKEAASRPTSTEPASYTLSRPTTDTTFTRYGSDTAYSCDDRSQAIPLPKRHAQSTWHELQLPSSPTV